MLADQHKEATQTIGQILVDSQFSPVTRVMFNVEDARVGQALRALRSVWVLLLVVVGLNAAEGGPDAWWLALDEGFRLVGVFLASALFMGFSFQRELMFFWNACFRSLGVVGLPDLALAFLLLVATIATL